MQKDLRKISLASHSLSPVKWRLNMLQNTADQMSLDNRLMSYIQHLISRKFRGTTIPLFLEESSESDSCPEKLEEMGVKNEKLLHITLLLLLISPPLAESFIFTAIATAIGFAYTAYTVINDAYDTYNKFVPQTSLDDVLDQAVKVEEKVDQIGSQLSIQINQTVEAIVTSIDHLNNIREGMGKLSTGFRRIDNLYRLFELYTSRQVRLNNHTLQNYINEVTGFSANAPKDILHEIYDVILPTSGLRESLLHYIYQDTPRNDTDECENGPPPLGILYHLFRLIMVNEVRAFTMMAFSYALDQAFKCESFEGEIELADSELRTRALDYYIVFSELTERALNSIRRCDPADGWVKGENYFEFERFKSEFIVSARVFKPPNENCGSGCSSDSLTVINCDQDYGCFEDTTCKGTVRSCERFKAPATVCELKPPGRRYTYIKNGDGEIWGMDDPEGCKTGVERRLEKKNNCDICWCRCTEDSYKSPSFHTFSTREQLSDAANNKAVTGVKLVVKENLLHIQIQQGKVVNDGGILLGSVKWKDLENIKFDAKKTLNDKKLVYYIPSNNGPRYEMEEEKDFISFSADSYAIDLDDLKVPPGYVVTGVKLSTDDSFQRAMRLALHISPYDYDRGKIEITDDNPSIWFTSSDMAGHDPEYNKFRKYMTPHVLENPFQLENSSEVTVPRSSPNSRMDIQTTDLKGDAGQTNVPFIDVQEVIGKPSFAAGGIGLYYKSISEEFAGFIGLRLWALEPMKNMKVNVLNELDQYKENITEFHGCGKKKKGKKKSGNKKNKA